MNYLPSIPEQEAIKNAKEIIVKQKHLKPSTIYMFVYRTRNGLSHEVVDLSTKFEHHEITDEFAKAWYEKVLVNFNNTLKPYESKRKLVRFYLVEQTIMLTKITV